MQSYVKSWIETVLFEGFFLTKRLKSIIVKHNWIETCIVMVAVVCFARAGVEWEWRIMLNKQFCRLWIPTDDHCIIWWAGTVLHHYYPTPFISTARCSRRSSVLNLSDKPLLIPGWVGFWQIALSVPNGPSGSSMVPVDPQMAPDSPRESQTIIQVSEKFPSFTIFLSTIY